MQKVLLAEGVDGFQEELRQILSSEYEVLCAHDGKRVRELLKQTKPDLLILNLELPVIDGISLLQQVMCEAQQPAVLVLARLLSDYTVDVLVKMGIGYLMRKPCKASNTAQRAKELLAYQAQAETRMYATVSRMLSELSIPVNLRGSKYLPLAIRSMRRDPSQYITKELYPSIGKMYGIDGKRVERCIRNAIDKGWESGDPRTWEDYFGIDRNGMPIRPSNSVFIIRLAQLLADDMKKCEM